MSNSSLVSYTRISPNRNSPRNHAIDRITPHCVVGQLSAERICGLFTSQDDEASCNYAIGTDGKIGLCVEEKDRSWCSSSKANDHRAVTIECACDKDDPYAMTDAVYQSLINLCIDICRRNGKSMLLWFGDKDKTLAYEPKGNEMVLTVHRWFANKACPGDWLYARLGDLAAQVNAQLSGGSSAPATDPDGTLYRVQVGAFTEKGNADAMLVKVKAAGFDTYMVQSGGYYKIQVGAYSVKSNADAMLAKVQAAGFDAFITTTGGTAAKLTNPYPVPTRTIKYVPGQPTMTGEDVKWVQWVLVQAGYNIEIDGKFGPASAAALRAYQAAHGLEVDGRCGPATRASMQAD